MTASLQHILFGVALREVIGSTNQEIVDIQIDSRLVQAGTAFVAALGDAVFLAVAATLAVVFMVMNFKINGAYSLYG
jgi:UDP-N-acetylmuramyl pentapeptide synthase